MAIDTAAKRQAAFLGEMVSPDGTIAGTFDRSAMLGQYALITISPPTGTSLVVTGRGGRGDETTRGARRDGSRRGGGIA